MAQPLGWIASWVKGQLFTGRYFDLLPDKIDAGRHFRHRMLDLDPGVDLHKIKMPLPVQKKFHGTGIDIMTASAARTAIRAHGLPQIWA